MVPTPIDYATPFTPRPRRQQGCTVVHEPDGLLIEHGPRGMRPVALIVGLLVPSLLIGTMIGVTLWFVIVPTGPTYSWRQVARSVSRPSMFGGPAVQGTVYNSEYGPVAGSEESSTRQRRDGALPVLLIFLPLGGMMVWLWRSRWRTAWRVATVRMDGERLALTTDGAGGRREVSWPRPTIAAIFVDAISGNGVRYDLAMITRDGTLHRLIEDIPSADVHTLAAACTTELAMARTSPLDAK